MLDCANRFTEQTLNIILLDGKLSSKTNTFKKIDAFLAINSHSLLKVYPTTAPCYAGKLTPNLLWASIAPAGA